MFKRIISFLKAPWICGVVTKTILGITATLVVLDYITQQVDGSEIGDKINDAISKVYGFLVSAKDALVKLSSFVCGGESVEASTMTLDDALGRLGSVSQELKDI